jgi:TRAP-type C4-dicarboxylate transport system permease small subunit
MVSMLVITSAQVFCRYVLSSPLIWAEEVCRYLLIWMCFLFAGAAFQRGEMAVIELVTAALPRRVRALVMVPAYIITAGFLGVLVYYGWGYAQQNRDQAIVGVDFLWQSLTGRDSGMSMAWVYLAVPVGCGILALHFLVSAGRLTVETLTRTDDAGHDG